MAGLQATANPAGSESAAPSTSLDDPANLNWLEPGEEPEANPPAVDEQVSADETDETPEDGDQEAETVDETAEGEPEETEGQDPEEEAEDPEAVIVTLQTGEKVPLKELKAGYMMERDYRHKTGELATKRRDLDEMTARVTKSVDAIADFLAKQIPDAPDPSLAMTNPGEYVRQRAMHEAAMTQVNAIIEQANAPKDVVAKLTDEQKREAVDTEFRQLAQFFPQVAKPEGRKAFFDNAASAAKEIGYSDEEIQQSIDHRMFRLAHYAALGLKAEKAKATANKKVENVPPVATGKRQAGQPAAKARANQEAMKKLSKTGSIHDAMSIDFD